ncbi:MAG: RraA family protein [Zavarzinella sp.]
MSNFQVDYPTVGPEVLAALRKFDTPTICNVLELLDVQPRTAGYTDSRIQSCFPELPPMVGYASTATFRAGSPPRGGDVYAGLSKQVELIASSPGPVVVVFQDLDDPSVAATFGEVMCTTYQSFGAVGLITSGTGRDLDQVQALKFPCFTGGTICSHGYCQVVDLHIPVRAGGLTIYPGDLIHGDRNGIAVIPTHLAAAIAKACPLLADAENIVLNYLKSGPPTPEGFAHARMECAKQIAELANRLKVGAV